MKIERVKGGVYLITDESGKPIYRIETRTLNRMEHIWFMVDPVAPVYKGVKRYPSLRSLLLTEFPFGFTNRNKLIDSFYERK